MENSVQSSAAPLRFLCSLDHLVRPPQHSLRNRQTDLLSCFQIDHQLEIITGLFQSGSSVGFRAF